MSLKTLGALAIFVSLAKKQLNLDKDYDEKEQTAGFRK